MFALICDCHAHVSCFMCLHFPCVGRLRVRVFHPDVMSCYHAYLDVLFCPVYWCYSWFVCHIDCMSYMGPCQTTTTDGNQDEEEGMTNDTTHKAIRMMPSMSYLYVYAANAHTTSVLYHDMFSHVLLSVFPSSNHFSVHGHVNVIMYNKTTYVMSITHFKWRIRVWVKVSKMEEQSKRMDTLCTDHVTCYVHVYTMFMLHVYTAQCCKLLVMHVACCLLPVSMSTHSLAFEIPCTATFTELLPYLQLIQSARTASQLQQNKQQQRQPLIRVTSGNNNAYTAWPKTNKEHVTVAITGDIAYMGMLICCRMLV